MLEKVKKETTADKVAKQLRSRIECGEFKAGDKIPSERQLCELMSVSRIAIREAIKGLAAKGLLEVRTGEGTYVKLVTSEDLIDPLTILLMNDYSLRELMEFRWAIEVRLAGLAAKRASEQDIENIEECLRGMEEDVKIEKDYDEHDIAFHNAVAKASGNSLMAAMMNQAGELIRTAIKQTVRLPGAFLRAYKIHFDVYENIRLHNIQGAQSAMSEHLREVERSLIEAQKSNKDN
jgi:GntR family transcriptional regulator, transcriptional repressor for pyruvate dehydrogenase complex